MGRHINPAGQDELYGAGGYLWRRGFGNIAHRACVQGLANGLRVFLYGYDRDRDVRVALAYLGNPLQPVHSRHHEVHQKEIDGGILFQEVQGFR